jgi:hypothetical protein
MHFAAGFLDDLHALRFRIGSRANQKARPRMRGDKTREVSVPVPLSPMRS